MASSPVASHQDAVPASSAECVPSTATGERVKGPCSSGAFLWGADVVLHDPRMASQAHDELCRGCLRILKSMAAGPRPVAPRHVQLTLTAVCSVVSDVSVVAADSLLLAVCAVIAAGGINRGKRCRRPAFSRMRSAALMQKMANRRVWHSVACGDSGGPPPLLLLLTKTIEALVQRLRPVAEDRAWVDSCAFFQPFSRESFQAGGLTLRCHCSPNSVT